MKPFTIGDSAARSKTISEMDVQTFADLVGDHNPLHLDENYAAQSRFGGRVAHGMLLAGLISAVIANELPGSIYMGQSLKFKKPVFLGETITATVTITSYNERRRMVTLETLIRNQAGDVVVEGEATILVPEPDTPT